MAVSARLPVFQGPQVTSRTWGLTVSSPCTRLYLFTFLSRWDTLEHSRDRGTGPFPLNSIQILTVSPCLRPVPQGRTLSTSVIQDVSALEPALLTGQWDGGPGGFCSQPALSTCRCPYSSKLGFWSISLLVCSWVHGDLQSQFCLSFGTCRGMFLCIKKAKPKTRDF